MDQENNLATNATLTIIRYPGWAIPFAFLSMAIFRIPLFLKKKMIFWRLMGCGKNGTFDKTPDLNQWAILTVYPATIIKEFTVSSTHQNVALKAFLGTFINGWIKLFASETITFLLEPIEGHGLWNGKEVFGVLPKNTGYEGEIAVMTRATIRLSKLTKFWSHVPATAAEMAKADGFVKSYGIGEWPFIKQATFSIWNSKAQMKAFAYKTHHHKDVIRKTHSEQWYSEEMFVRFRILNTFQDSTKHLP